MLENGKKREAADGNFTATVPNSEEIRAGLLTGTLLAFMDLLHFGPLLAS